MHKTVTYRQVAKHVSWQSLSQRRPKNINTWTSKAIWHHQPDNDSMISFLFWTLWEPFEFKPEEIKTQRNRDSEGCFPVRRRRFSKPNRLLQDLLGFSQHSQSSINKYIYILLSEKIHPVQRLMNTTVNKKCYKKHPKSWVSCSGSHYIHYPTTYNLIGPNMFQHHFRSSSKF